MASAPLDDPIRAAGAVVWRPGSDGPGPGASSGPRIALVHRPKYDDWSFPKGKREPGEHVLLTATREVAEEAAVRVVLGRRLKPSEYEVDGRPKMVSYWAARCVEAFDFVPNHEVDDLAWIDLPHVAERLSYDRDRILIEEFAAGPLSTIPLILLRHAQAGTRSQDGLFTDLARPLDSHGTQDAQLLAELLVSYGPCRVITSAAERCIATVRPYAEAVGMPVELEPDFTATGEDPDLGTAYLPAARRAVALAAQRQPTLICAHRENLPVIINAARTELGADLGAKRGAGFGAECGADLGADLGAGENALAEQSLGKGSFVVLQSADGVLVSSERHDLTDLGTAKRGAARVGRWVISALASRSGRAIIAEADVTKSDVGRGERCPERYDRAAPIRSNPAVRSIREFIAALDGPEPMNSGIHRVSAVLGHDGCGNSYPISRMDCHIHRRGWAGRQDGLPYPPHGRAVRVRVGQPGNVVAMR